MKKPLFEGIIVPIITPFDKHEAIDELGFKHNIEFLISEGVHGVVVCGSSGEFYKMTTEERKKVLELAIEQAAGRVPIYAGTGANSTREALILTNHAKQTGADGALILPPNFMPPNTEEIIEYYHTIIQEVDLPVCLYNLPDRTQVNLSPTLVDRLSKLNHIVAIKESTNNIVQMSETIRLTGNHLKVLIGHDLLILPAICMGASGVISPSPNVFGRLTVELYNLAKQGRIEEAQKLQYKLYAFRATYSMGTFPLVIKEAMNIVGMCGGYPRRPTLPMSQDSLDHLRQVMRNLDVFPCLKQS